MVSPKVLPQGVSQFTSCYLTLYPDMCLACELASTKGNYFSVQLQRFSPSACLVFNNCIVLPGNVPGPILFGFVFDKACSVWREECDDRGSCWIYHGEKLSANLTTLGAVVRVFSTLFFCTFIHRE